MFSEILGSCPAHSFFYFFQKKSEKCEINCRPSVLRSPTVHQPKHLTCTCTWWQVLKTNTRFSATIRLLVGTKLNVHMSPPVGICRATP